MVTNNYMAPELLLDFTYSGIKVDVFALGVVLFMLMTGNRPFNVAKADDLYYKTL